MKQWLQLFLTTKRSKNLVPSTAILLNGDGSCDFLVMGCNPNRLKEISKDTPFKLNVSTDIARFVAYI